MSSPSTHPEQELDVRVIPPREKHPTIHARLGALPINGVVHIINDHDPRPLRFELEADHPGAFSWQYLEQGPETWRVEVRRLR